MVLCDMHASYYKLLDWKLSVNIAESFCILSAKSTLLGYQGGENSLRREAPQIKSLRVKVRVRFATNTYKNRETYLLQFISP